MVVLWARSTVVIIVVYIFSLGERGHSRRDGEVSMNQNRGRCEIQFVDVIISRSLECVCVQSVVWSFKSAAYYVSSFSIVSAVFR